jgi:hypothetical protein
MTKCVTSPPLFACTVDGHTLVWKIVNKKSAPFFKLTYFFIKKFTGHACPPGDDICRSNCEILPVNGRHLFLGLVPTILKKSWPCCDNMGKPSTQPNRNASSIIQLSSRLQG